MPGYTSKGNHLQFFMPVAGLAAGAVTVMEALDIGAASGDHGEMICTRACRLVGIGFIPVAEAVSGTTTAPTVIYTKRPTPGSATGETVAATLTCPTGAAIGAVIYDEPSTQTEFEIGDAVEISWTIGVGTPTGIGHWFGIFEASPQDPLLATGYLDGST